MEEGFSIGKTKPKNKLVLAPMMNVSDLAFRLLCRAQGAGLCFTEFINSEAIARGNNYGFRLAQSCSKDRPLGLQLFGAKPASMEKAAVILAKEADFDFFDLNLGCSDAKILRQGAGAALLKRPKRAQELVKALRAPGKPVTAKIRISPNVLESIKFCKALEEAGVSAITVHAKTVRQGYSGEANFVAVKRIAKAVSVPVIANGNIGTENDVERTLKETRAVAVMVGRKAMGNPGVFAELQGRKGISPTDALLKYLELCEEYGIGNFGKVKTQTIRFLSREKRTAVIEKVQKAKDKESLLKAVHSL